MHPNVTIPLGVVLVGQLRGGHPERLEGHMGPCTHLITSLIISVILWKGFTGIRSTLAIELGTHRILQGKEISE